MQLCSKHVKSFINLPFHEVPTAWRQLSTMLEKHPHFFIVHDAVSKEEERDLVNYLDPLLQRKRYEGEHWDSVIVQYKETELRQISARGILMPGNVAAILSRLQNLVKANYAFHVQDLLLPHAIDLSGAGKIDYHVDNIRHSGGVLSGLSLMSKRTLRLRRQHDDDVRAVSYHQSQQQPWSATEVAALRELRAMPDWNSWEALAKQLNGEGKDKKFMRKALECEYKYQSLLLGDKCGDLSSAVNTRDVKVTEAENFDFEIELPPRSLYMLDGPLRYQYAHAILGSDQSMTDVKAGRRLSIMFRDAPPSADAMGNTPLETGGLKKISKV